MRYALILAFGIIFFPSFSAWAQTGSESLSYSHSLTFGSKGKALDNFDYPTCITVDNYSSIYVTDWNNSRVVKLNSDGEPILVFSATPQGSKPSLSKPIGIAASNRDEIIVADYNNHRVVRFSLDGGYIGNFGQSGNQPGQFRSPRGLAVDKNGDIIVADFDNYRIQTFSFDGKFKSQFRCALPDEMPQKYYSPRSVAVDNDGRLVVILSEIDKIVVYDNSGKPLFSFGSSGTSPGQFKRPRYLDIDLYGRIFITDQGNSRVQIFTPDGRFLAYFDNAEKTPKIEHPEGIALDKSGNIFMADSNSARLLRFDAHPILALRTWALRYDRAGLNEKAVNQYEKILERSPSDKEALARVLANYLEKAKSADNNGDEEEASQFFQQVKKLEPNNSEARAFEEKLRKREEDEVLAVQKKNMTVASVIVLIFMTIVLLIFKSSTTKIKRIRKKKEPSQE